MSDKLRILLAEDHLIVRAGVRLLINSQPDMEVVGEADNGETVVRQAQQLNPDIILLDISMPEVNGLKAAKKLKKVCPEAKILTLTRHTDDGYLQQMIQAGVSGYILKQSAPTELIGAIRTVNTGSNYLDPFLTKKVMGGYVSRPSSLKGENRAVITDREEEILRLIAWGYSNKEIATRNSISVKTVEAHKSNAMRKLNIGSRIDIVRYAILKGWLQDN